MLLVYKHYDQRIHQPTLEHMKQILQTLFKKVDNHVSTGTFHKAKMGLLPPLASKNMQIQLRIVLKTMSAGLNLFPNCFSQVIQSKQGGGKKTSSSVVLENLIGIFSEMSETSPSAS